MSAIYIKEQGTYVQKSGERILVTKNGARLFEIPVFQMDNLCLIGNVQISTQALHMLMEKGVDVSYLSYSGKYLGHTAADASSNIFLRFEQYQMYLNEERRLSIARSITENKIKNQLEVIKRHRWDGSDYDWKSDAEQMERHLTKLTKMDGPNEILGIEGICSNIYFRSFAQMLHCDFTFDGRNRRPPRDPVNVILSLTYTLLTKELCNALDAESFEPYLGFLHGIRYGRKSLALDIIEEFRQPVVDRLVIILFNKRMIGKYDFEFPEEDHVILTEEGFRKFCTEYERWMNGKNSLSGNPSFRNLIRSQVKELKKAITEHRDYAPYRWRGTYVSDQL